MGIFDLPDLPPVRPNAAPDQRPAPPQTNQGDALSPLEVVRRVVLAIPHPVGLRPYALRDQVGFRLQSMGWYCRRRNKVASRGTPDGYKGILDLVAHPPAPAGAQALPDPVLVEFDAVSVEKRTLAKLAHYEGRTAGVMIVLTAATEHQAIPGVDEVLCLA